MSDTESVTASHPTTGGKSLAAIERPPYKSWRKKFRKMHAKFDGILEENRRIFKEEQKLESIAKRLREELDGLLELCLDLNNNAALPPSHRYDVSLPKPHTEFGNIGYVVPEGVTPTAADEIHSQFVLTAQTGKIPPIDVHVVKYQVDDRLHRQGITSIDKLESTIPHPAYDGSLDSLPEEINCDTPPGYLLPEHEDVYLARLDAKLDPSTSILLPSKSADRKDPLEDIPWTDLTSRETDRQAELLNPQSQHNWLKLHAKHAHPAAIDVDDTESLASHHEVRPTARPHNGKRNLAKQVGDRSVGRARETLSPGAASAVSAVGDDEDFAWVDENPGSGKKRGRGEADGTYRLKGGRSSTGSKGKRKRSGEEGSLGRGEGKKARVEDD